jgi:hypothetical protein
MKLHLNYTQSFQFGNSLPKTTIFSNIIKERQGKLTVKKSFKNKVGRFINKLSPQHWYDGVWDDLHFDI